MKSGAESNEGGRNLRNVEAERGDAADRTDAVRKVAPQNLRSDKEELMISQKLVRKSCRTRPKKKKSGKVTE